MEFKQIKKDLLEIRIYRNRKELGEAAAKDAAGYITELLKKRETINMIFAAAPSQNEFLDILQTYPIPWERIHAFHMDEYIGLAEEASQRFGNYLKEHLFGKVHFRSVHYLYHPEAPAGVVCKVYTQLLEDFPVDIVCMGIGENGHIAFNDPHVALFQDPEQVKVVTLDDVCRRQQVHDGCFRSLKEVPQQAVTLTIPALMRAGKIFCMVPAATKSAAIRQTVCGDISESCPASILRTHPAATLYCDQESAKLIFLKRSQEVNELRR
ncbi:MAG: glucosamine-6-phosphate deaminase [Tannerellaceae bacterium]|nr:glucosamine-6-phosphate deaminase [Tannerellaceae bacterium]